MKPLALFLVLLLTCPAPAADVDYTRDIKPVLAKHCYTCHGGEKQRSGLRLDTAVFALQGGNSGAAIVPGKAKDSRLIHAITGAGETPVMPPKGPRLGEREVALLRRWIDDGAKAPAGEVGQAGKVVSKHWAFQPIRRPAPPVVKDEKAVRNPIDRFILARLEKDGLRPSPEADRATLIRRLSLDLTGMPPAPEEVDAFLADRSPDAYEKVVERLLASPHYGERWGRHWLDLARYADSNGFTIDAPRSIWPYRDWVIRAVNADVPFDRFTIEQLAGDLLPGATREQRVATGFHRNTLFNQEGGIDQEQFRVEYVVDRVNTTGSVWLGLTVGCCQCHDHKFDPLSQREYYQFFAFFNSCEEPSLELPTPQQAASRKEIMARVADLEKLKKSVDRTSPTGFKAWEEKLTAADKIRLPDEAQRILQLDPTSRTPKDRDQLFDVYREADWVKHVVGAVGPQPPLLPLSQVQLVLFRQSVDRRIAELKKDLPPIPTTMVLSERKTPRETHVQIMGDFTRKGARVGPAVPAVLPALSAKTPNRLELARWLVDPANPLTARVAVNRVWQAYFGLGLVETENDFGTQGTLPSHPELLDWLASEFSQTWSPRALHRLIVTSATYRQSSKARPDLGTVDPRNRLLARQNRLRLEAEVVRDVALAASGVLSRTIGGPSVFPPQPEGVYAFTQLKKDWQPSRGPDRYRRGLYTYLWRSAPHPGMTAFDGPDGNVTCTRRTRSNTPLQALTLLNDEAYYEFAQALARRALKECKGDDAGRLAHLFRLCLARSPSERELKPLLRLLAETPEADAWTMAARVLLNLDEFITRE